MELKDFLIKNGALNSENYLSKGKSQMNRGPIKIMLAQSIFEYLQEKDFLTPVLTEYEYLNLLKELKKNHLLDEKAIKNLGVLCYPSINQEIEKLGIKYSTIKQGIDDLILKESGREIESKVELIANFKTERYKDLKAMTSIMYLNQEKFEKLIKENTEFSEMIRADFNYPKELAVPKKSKYFQNNL